MKATKENWISKAPNDGKKNRSTKVKEKGNVDIGICCTEPTGTPGYSSNVVLIMFPATNNIYPSKLGSYRKRISSKHNK